MKKKYLFYLILVLLSACKENNKNEESQRNIIIQDFKHNKIDISNYAKTTFLLLELGSDNLLGEIKDICISKDKIYILDGITSSIFLFDLKTGNLIKSINKKGVGPNEYVFPTALSIDDNYLYVLDAQVHRILQFDLSLNLITSIDIPKMMFTDFCITPTGFVLSNQFVLKDSYNLICLNKQGKQIKGLIPFSEKYNGLGKYNWGRLGNIFSNQTFDSKKLTISLTYDNNIYVLDDKLAINTVISNNYKELTLPESAKINDMNIFENNYVLPLGSFLLDNSMLVSTFMHKKSRYYSFYNLKTKECQTGKVINKNNGVPFFPIWVHKNHLIGTMSLIDLKEADEDAYNSLLKDKKRNIDEESKVLVTYTF